MARCCCGRERHSGAFSNGLLNGVPFVCVSQAAHGIEVTDQSPVGGWNPTRPEQYIQNGLQDLIYGQDAL